LPDVTIARSNASACAKDGQRSRLLNLRYGPTATEFEIQASSSISIWSASSTCATRWPSSPPPSIAGCQTNRSSPASNHLQGRAAAHGSARLPGGTPVIDDFGHHPSAIRETLRALRHRYAQQRLWAVFEPRSNTNPPQCFQEELPYAFADADAVVIAKLPVWNCSAGGAAQPGEAYPGTSRRSEDPPPICPMPMRLSPTQTRSPRGRRDLRFQQRRFWQHPRKTAGRPGPLKSVTL